MFEYLNRKFPPLVEVVGYEQPEVLLTSKHPLALGETEVRATVAGVKMKALVQVVESSAESCRCYWLSPPEALPYLAQLFAPEEKRRCPRFPRALRVKSPQGFQGWSQDLSEQGLRFETHSGLGLGQTVPIVVDLDDAFETRLEVNAGVRWCAPALADGWIMAGLEFQDLDRDSLQFQRYQKFLEKLAASQV